MVLETALAAMRLETARLAVRGAICAGDALGLHRGKSH